MSSYEKWIDALRTYPEGRIWRNNFEFDQKCGNLPADTVDLFIDAFHLINFECKDSSDVAQTKQDIKTAFEQILALHPHSFDLRCTREPTVIETYCRVMVVGSFVKNNFDYAILGLGIDDTLDDQIWNLLNDDASKTFFKGTLRGWRPFFWGARAEVFNEMVVKFGLGDRIATEVCHQFGLSGIGEGIKILQIVVPTDKLAGKVVRAPTSLDAGVENFVFVPSDDTAGGYGWTLNLADGGRGAEEIIIEEIFFNSDYEVNRIGITEREIEAPNTPQLEVESETRLATYGRS